MLASLLILLTLQEKPRPVVAAFDRFEQLDPAEGGRLLIGELGCTNCHADATASKKGPNLSDAGGRLKADWIRAWLKDPHAIKPGTTMPKVATPEDVEALTHFLMSMGKPVGLTSGAGPKGAELYAQSGCMACHGPSESLGNAGAKWRDAAALAAFLHDPIKWRPSGRMPKLNLTPQEAMAIAVRLAGAPPCEPDDAAGPLEPGVAWELYEGNFSKLPDFDVLKPAASGTSAAIELGVAKKEDHFALRFRAYLDVPKEGVYTFTTSSDDGSRLTLGRTVIVDNDGVHGGTEVAGSRALKKGKYLLTVTFFEASGGEELAVTWEGPGFGKRKIEAKSLSRGAFAAKEVEVAEAFKTDPALAAKGRELFQSLRCASCHDADKLKSPPSRPLATLKGPTCTVVKYPLDERQTEAVEAGLKEKKDVDPLLAFNCYACHERKRRGGPSAMDAAFVGQDQTIGDEGRHPPHLNGVGAKLRPEWLKQVLQQGTKVRPYVFTRMPVFGPDAMALVDYFLKMDVAAPETPLAKDKDLIKAGRQLTGTKGMSCVSCHQFQGHKSQGIPGMDLVVMGTRLRKDWFERYLREPSSLRPGTRMPTFWPDGKSVRKDILDGDTAKQIDALWLYLGEGGKAQIPIGIGPQPILLSATEEPVIYRNFIQGAGPRAIGVGYPEHVNLAWDANQMTPKLLWQGDFIDAARHWVDRGAGFQGPAGDNVLALPDGPPFSTSDAWPKETGKAAGYQFGGYELDKKGRPSFLYTFKGLKVRDAFEPAPGKLTRTLTLEGAPVELWFRDRESKLPVKFENGKAVITVSYAW